VSRILARTGTLSACCTRNTAPGLRVAIGGDSSHSGIERHSDELTPALGDASACAVGGGGQHHRHVAKGIRIARLWNRNSERTQLAEQKQ
jgi:hypothetical protein